MSDRARRVGRRNRLSKIELEMLDAIESLCQSTCVITEVTRGWFTVAVSIWSGEQINRGAANLSEALRELLCDIVNTRNSQLMVPYSYVHMMGVTARELLDAHVPEVKAAMVAMALGGKG